MSSPDNKSPQIKNIPINKYSVYDLKNGIDTRIIEYLEKNGYEEIHTYSNIKILIGLFCLIWTAVAYLNGLPFDKAYNLILVSVVFYFIGSTSYWYLEKKVIKSTFYSGKSLKLIQNGIDFFRLSSEIENFSEIYSIGISYKLNGKEIHEPILKKPFSLYFDDRGYCVRSKVNELSDELLLKLSGNKKIN